MEQRLVLMEANVVAVALVWVRRWAARRAAHRRAVVHRRDGPPHERDRTRAPEQLTWLQWSILILLLVGVLLLVVQLCSGA